VPQYTLNGLRSEVLINTNSTMLPLLYEHKKQFIEYVENKNSLLKTEQNLSLESFINTSISTIDSYGLGITLLLMIDQLPVINTLFQYHMKNLVFGMIHPNVHKRLHITNALQLDDQILDFMELYSNYIVVKNDMQCPLYSCDWNTYHDQICKSSMQIKEDNEVEKEKEKEIEKGKEKEKE
jgi:hypothetical protein